MKIVWLSTNTFGYELLREVIRLVKVDTVITLSDKATTIMYDGIEFDKWDTITKYHQIQLIEIEDINEEINCLKEIQPDYIIVAGWRQIISKEILDIPKYGVISFHPSPLPVGRGPAPIINTILLGMEWSASTMFFMDEGVDSGDVIAQEIFYINPNDYAIDVYNKYIEASIQLCKAYLPLLKDGEELTRYQQDNTEATYFPKRTLKDNEITLFDTLEQINRKIRAFSKPYLGAFIKHDYKKLIIERCRFEEA